MDSERILCPDASGQGQASEYNKIYSLHYPEESGL